MHLSFGLNGFHMWQCKLSEIIWRTLAWRHMLCRRSHSFPGKINESGIFGQKSIGHGHLPIGARLSSQTRPKSTFLIQMGDSGAIMRRDNNYQANTLRKRWNMVEGILWFGVASHVKALGGLSALKETWTGSNMPTYWRKDSWEHSVISTCDNLKCSSSKTMIQSIRQNLFRLGLEESA